MRVLVVGKAAPDRGGIPSFIGMLEHSELARRHDLRFLNLARNGTRQGGRLTPENVRRTLSDGVAVYRAARGAQIVHVHTALTPTVTVVRAFLLSVAARAAGSKVIVHAHGGALDGWLKGRRRRTIMRIAMWPVARVVAVWGAGYRALSSVLGPERVLFIQNGVDLEAFGSARPECPRGHRPRVLYVGLLTPRKGVVDLIDASRQLLEEGIDHELWIVGGTPDEGQVAEEAVRRSAHPGVVFRGTRQPEEMPSVYASADVFCLPSWWEAMPLSVLEAMAAGLPVVATDVGDVKQAIGDGSSGILVPPRSPEQLASALRELLLDAGRRADLGEGARRTASTRFASTTAVDATDDLYHQLAEGRS